MLEIIGLTKNFGGLAAVVNLDLKVQQEEIFGLIGPNGAGKSTILNMIDGSLRPAKGKVIFKGEEITNRPPHIRAKKGIARVFQPNIIFPDLTVTTNVLVGFHLHSQIRFWDSFFNRKNYINSREKFLNEKTNEILQLVGLYSERDKVASGLPHASQRRLCLAIALAVQPSLLLLDEPLTGMDAEEVATMLSTIRLLRTERGITCIVVEHNVKAVMSLCDRIAVVNYGIKIAEGLPSEITENQAVIEAYLGVEDAA